MFQSVEKLQHAIEYPDVELGPPPARLAAAGRMNAFGISVFYGAVTADTAIAEVRPPVGSRVLLGRFELTRTLRLLDVEVLRDIYVKGSLFDPAFSRNLERAKFLAGLSWRMTKPVLPEQEPFEHLATQAIADFLSSEVDPTVDGMVYPSVQASSGTPNVVLFHKSSRVEPLKMPAGTEVDSHCAWVDPSDDSEQDDYEDEGDRYWVFEEVAPPETSQPVEQEKHRIILLPVPKSAEFDARASALKLDTDSREVLPRPGD